MNKKFSRRCLTIAGALFIWLSLFAGGNAQTEVNPGNWYRFGRFESGKNQDTGVIKRTIPIVGGEVVVSQALSRFNLMARSVEASSEVRATLLSAGVVGSASAYIDTSFRLSGTTQRSVDAVISADVVWKGFLFTLVSIGGGTSNASISLQLIDDTVGAPVAHEEIFSQEGRANLSSFQDPLSFVSGEQPVTIQTKLIRGHRYTIRFRIDCEVRSSIASGGMISNFHSAAQELIPAGPRGAAISNLIMLIGPDLEETLGQIKDQLTKSQSDLSELVGAVNTNVTNSFNSLSQSVSATNTNVLAVDARLATVQNTVNATQANTITMISQLSGLQTSVNTANGKLDTIDGKADIITEKVDTAISKVDTTNTNVNIVSAKVDDLAAKLMEFQRRALRLEIEQALVEGDRYNVASFQMPQTAGGFLEEVRSVVNDVLDICRKSEAPPAFAITQAEQSLRAGDVFYQAKGYKDAYDHYRAAYLHLAIVPGNHRP
ncbi:MAG: hypothetical protein AB7U82_16295 [Blastocatellales bacterium]